MTVQNVQQIAFTCQTYTCDAGVPNKHAAEQLFNALTRRGLLHATSTVRGHAGASNLTTATSQTSV